VKHIPSATATQAPFLEVPEIIRSAHHFAKRSTIGRNLQDELDARDGCRYGLPGVLVTIEEHDGVYIIDHAKWGPGEQLLVSAYPADGPPPQRCNCVDPEHHRLTHTGDCFMNLWKPPGFLRNVPAWDCTLASEWPVVCCEPEEEETYEP
jgi:hypothetical protein